MNVIQFAMLADHMHLIVEAKDNQALTSGIKSLTSTIAKRFKKRFKGRYHLRIITTPTQMRNTYRYVLLNYAKHADLPAHIDDYSTGTTFEHWNKLAKLHREYEEEAAEDYGFAPPRSWLAHKGWLRSGSGPRAH